MMTRLMDPVDDLNSSSNIEIAGASAVGREALQSCLVFIKVLSSSNLCKCSD